MNWISARYILMSTDWRKKLHRLFALLISDMEIEDLQSQGFETSCFAFHPDGRWKTLRRWFVWKCFYFLLFFLFLLGGTSIHAKESSSTSGGCSGWRLRLLRWRVFHLRRLLRWRLQWRQWNDRSQQWSTIQDSGHALDDQVYECASPSAEALFACVLDVTPSPDRSLENVGVVEDRLGISVVIIYMKCLFSAHLLKRHLLKLERNNKLCN